MNEDGNAQKDALRAPALLRRGLALEQRVALTNLSTKSSNAAIIVWKGQARPDGWEYGVELLAPEMDFWGLEL